MCTKNSIIQSYHFDANREGVKLEFRESHDKWVKLLCHIVPNTITSEGKLGFITIIDTFSKVIIDIDTF